MDSLLTEGGYFQVCVAVFCNTGDTPRYADCRALLYPLGDPACLPTGGIAKRFRFDGARCVFIGDMAYEILKRRGHWLTIRFPNFPKSEPQFGWVYLGRYVRFNRQGLHP